MIDNGTSSGTVHSGWEIVGLLAYDFGLILGVALAIALLWWLCSVEAWK